MKRFVEGEDRRQAALLDLQVSHASFSCRSKMARLSTKYLLSISHRACGFAEDQHGQTQWRPRVYQPQSMEMAATSASRFT
jgi:hypothetical protein